MYRAVDEPEASRTAYWRHVFATVTGLEAHFDERPDSRDELLVGDVGPVHVVGVSSGPGEARRTARHIRVNDPDSYLLFVQDEGFALGEHRGRCSEFRPGDLGLVDLSSPLHCAGTERRAVMVSFPTALSPLRPDELSRLTGARIAGDGGTAGLVSSLVRQLPAHLDADDGAAGSRIGTAVLDLLNVGLASHLDRETTVSIEARTRALLVRCRSYIEQNLQDPDLSPGVVAAAHHISLRYLHSLFEPTGDGVAELIRRRRLDRVRRELLDPHQALRPVSAIGARWGLVDSAHFNRLFKTTYGLPPAEYRSVHGPEDIA